jgi:hypothetical protein
MSVRSDQPPPPRPEDRPPRPKASAATPSARPRLFDLQRPHIVAPCVPSKHGTGGCGRCGGITGPVPGACDRAKAVPRV